MGKFQFKRVPHWSAHKAAKEILCALPNLPPKEHEEYLTFRISRAIDEVVNAIRSLHVTPDERVEIEQRCAENAADVLFAALDNPELLRDLVMQFHEHGVHGPASLGLGRFGGHAIG